jgi:hypothetical protein
MGRIFNKMLRSKTIKIILILMVFVSSSMTINTRPAQAQCCGSCSSCASGTFFKDLSEWPQTEVQITVYIYIQLLLHQLIWFDWVYWQQHMLPLFMHIGNHLAGVGAFQVMIIGQFIDAQQQLEAQRDLQVMHARANKDYHPSKGMCEFATRIQSLGASERKGEANALILSERSSDRLLGNINTGAWSGTKGDVAIRLDMFQRAFCDTFDNNNGLMFMCPSTSTSAAYNDRRNKDIDYQRTIVDPWTVSFDLTASTTQSKGDEEVIAMANNLYGFEAFERIDHLAMLNSPSDTSTEAQQAYLNLRAAVAKTKVAENSFNALMAMKGEGTAGSRDYLEAYLQELGVPAAEVREYVGNNPSYNAQMEVLTKKAYQSPTFYTNLYDKPANVERKGVAMQAIGLIQKFDLLKSYLRTEASLSVLLELSVLQLQRQVESNIQAFDEQSATIKRD